MSKALRTFLHTTTGATLFTILVTLLLGTVKILLNLQHHLGSPFILFYTAVVLSAWRGGFWQGLLSMFLSGTIILFAMDLAAADPSVWGWRFGMFTLDCLIITAICAQLQRALRRAERSAELTRANEELSLASEQLRESRTFLDSIVENIPNMIFVKDAKELRFVRFNRAGEELLGHTQAQLLGKNDYDLFPSEQADSFTAKDRDVIRGGMVVDIAEEPIETTSGTRFLHTKKIPIFDKDNRPLYLLGISEDITARKRAESQRHDLVQAQAAQAEAEKSAARLAFLSDASVALNHSPDLHDMLDAFARVVVRHIADACFVDLYDAKLPRLDRVAAALRDDEARASGLCGRILDGGSAEGSVTSVAAGAPPFIHSRIAQTQAALLGVVPDLAPLVFPLGDASGMVVPLSHHGEVMGVITLVCKHPDRYGDMDLALALDLAKRAAFAIDNAILYGRAHEASRAKSAFLANISHEIRTPLGAMLGFAELSLEEGGLSEQHAHNLKTIMRNGQHLLRIVDEVLDLSKVESERLDIERVFFNLSKLLDDVEILLSLKAEERGLTLSIRQLGRLPAVIKTDPLRLRQILLNIIGNAVKFTEKGGVDVQVRYHPRAGEKGQLEILVIDTGIGISPGQKEKLFRPFVQADESMTRRYGGTGLGLFLSRRFSRLLGGDVVLSHSTLEKGSVFRITLEAEPGESALPSPPERGEASLLATGDKLVLVVDDAKENRMLVNAYLTRLGIKAHMAQNGREGVDMALANDYALVLMDLQMPEMDGFEALRALRKEGYQRPIIAVTAHAMKGDRERCIQVGFDDYLCKPLSKQALADCLANFLS